MTYSSPFHKILCAVLRVKLSRIRFFIGDHLNQHLSGADDLAGGDQDRLDLSGFGRAQGMLHCPGLEQAQGLAGLDPWTGLDQELDDLPRHGRSGGAGFHAASRQWMTRQFMNGAQTKRRIDRQPFAYLRQAKLAREAIDLQSQGPRSMVDQLDLMRPIAQPHGVPLFVQFPPGDFMPALAHLQDHRGIAIRIVAIV